MKPRALVLGGVVLAAGLAWFAMSGLDTGGEVPPPSPSSRTSLGAPVPPSSPRPAPTRASVPIAAPDPQTGPATVEGLAVRPPEPPSADDQVDDAHPATEDVVNAWIDTTVHLLGQVRDFVPPDDQEYAEDVMRTSEDTLLKLRMGMASGIVPPNAALGAISHQRRVVVTRLAERLPPEAMVRIQAILGAVPLDEEVPGADPANP